MKGKNVANIKDAKHIAELLKKRDKLAAKYRVLQSLNPRKLVLKGIPVGEKVDGVTVGKGHVRHGAEHVFSWTEARKFYQGLGMPTSKKGPPLDRVSIEADDTVKRFFARYLCDAIADVDVALHSLGFTFSEQEEEKENGSV